MAGWNANVLLSAADGHMSASLWPSCQPIAPPVVADFSGDGQNDLIIICADR